MMGIYHNQFPDPCVVTSIHFSFMFWYFHALWLTSHNGICSDFTFMGKYMGNSTFHYHLHWYRWHIGRLINFLWHFALFFMHRCQTLGHFLGCAWKRKPCVAHSFWDNVIKACISIGTSRIVCFRDGRRVGVRLLYVWHPVGKHLRRIYWPWRSKNYESMFVTFTFELFLEPGKLSQLTFVCFWNCRYVFWHLSGS